MSVLTLDAARAAGIGGGLGDEALQDAIDGEEAWLARRIGQLVGERTQRFALANLPPRSSEVHLARPTDEVVLAQDAEPITDFELRGGGWVIAQLPEGTRYSGVLEATYTPNDEEEVLRVLRQLLSLELGVVEGGGLQSETIGTYSYQRAAGSSYRTRISLVRSLREPTGASSIRVRAASGSRVAAALGR